MKGIAERQFAAGTYICHRGDRLDYWTGVVSGLVKISAISESGKAVTFAGAGAGGCSARAQSSSTRHANTISSRCAIRASP